MENKETYYVVIEGEDNDSEEYGYCIFNHLEQRYYCLECISPIDTTIKPEICPYCGTRFIN